MLQPHKDFYIDVRGWDTRISHRVRRVLEDAWYPCKSLVFVLFQSPVRWSVRVVLSGEKAFAHSSASIDVYAGLPRATSITSSLTRASFALARTIVVE